MQPIADKILVKELPPQEISKGGIIIPEIAKKRPGRAKVVLVSQDITPITPTSRLPAPGDTILMDPECGAPVYFENEEHLMIVYGNVWAIE